MPQLYKIDTHEVILDSLDRKYILRVRDLAEEDKPREKMVKMGPRELLSPELLAIVLNTGSKKEEVLALSNRILKEYGEKSLASQTDPRVLERDFGIPFVKACQIIACFELGRRFYQRNAHGLTTVRTSKQAFEYLQEMGKCPKEQFRAIYLDSHYKIIHDEVISVGSLTASIVHPREVFKPALEYLAVALIVAHNHPSGSLKPTTADLNLTKQLVEAGKILGIDLLDHLIITKNKFLSILN